MRVTMSASAIPSRPSLLRAWYRATRPRTLGAAIAPVLVGTALVLPDAFHPFRFLLALAGSIAIQAATNMFNEHFDHVQGLDLTRPRRADQVVQTGVLSHAALFRGGVVAMLIGAICGLLLVAQTGWALLLVGLLSVFAGYAYTARPFALGYRALGEVTVFLFMGPVIVMGAAYVQTERWTWQAFLVSVPVGMLVTAILHLNNVRDINDDLANGKRTLANIFGRRIAGYEYVLLTVGAFVVVTALVAARVVTPFTLVALVLLPEATRIARLVALDSGVYALDRLMMRTALLHRNAGSLIALGLLAGAVWGWVR